MDPTPAERLAKAEAKANAELADAQAAHAKACFLQLGAPTEETCREVEALETEIAIHRQTLQRIAAAKAAAEQQDTTEAVEQRKQEARAALATVEASAQAEANELTTIVELFSHLGGHLARLEAATKAKSNATWSVLRNSVPKDQQSRASERLSLHRSDAPVQGVLWSALACSGLGHTGPTLAPYVVVDSPGTGFGTPSRALDAHGKATAKLMAHLNELVEQEKNHG